MISPNVTECAFETTVIGTVGLDLLGHHRAEHLGRARSAVLKARQQQPNHFTYDAARERALLALALDVVEFLAVVPFGVALVLSEMFASLRKLREPSSRRVHLAL